MRRLKESGTLRKAIFLIPPVSTKERLRRLSVLAESLDLPPESLTVAAGSTVLAVCVPDRPENPMVIASAAPDDTSYDLALGLCAQRLLGETLDPELLLLSKSVMEWSRPDPTPLPLVDVVPAGKAVAKKPLRRRVLTWVLVANIAIVPVAKALLTGNAGDSSDVIVLGSNIRVHEFLGQSGPNVFVLFNQGEVGSVNFDTRSGSYVGRLPGGAATAVFRDDHIYYLSGTGVARAWSLRSRRVVWTTRIGRGARSIVVLADRVMVADPVHSSIVALDPDSGRRITAVRVPGRPWAIVEHGDNAAVALPDRAEVVLLSLPSLNTVARIPGADAPYQLHLWNGRVLVTDSMGWWIHTVGSTEFRVVRSNRYGEVAAGVDVLAVEGVDKISVFSPNGVVRYNTSRVTTALGVLDDGSVLRATGNGVWRFTRR